MSDVQINNNQRTPIEASEAHVLVVEDNVPNFVLIARMLAFMGVQRCEWKTSGWQVVQFADTLPRVDASQDRRAADFAARVLADAPPGAIVVTSEDRDTFALWYAHYALGRRPDLAVVVEPLLDFDWYRRNLRAVYPGLAIPETPEDTWRAALATANGGPQRICRTDAEDEPALVCGEGP